MNDRSALSSGQRATTQVPIVGEGKRPLGRADIDKAGLADDDRAVLLSAANGAIFN